MKKHAVLSTALFSLVLGSAAVALADNPILDKAQVAFNVPAKWNVAVTADTVTLTDPKNEVALSLVSVDAKDTKDALSRLDKVLDTIVKDQKVGKPTEGTLNGMKIVNVDATGTIEGKKADVS